MDVGKEAADKLHESLVRSATNALDANLEVVMSSDGTR